MQHETMLEYVVRKLNEKAYNHGETARRTGLQQRTISLMKTGALTNPQHSTVEKLYNHFKSLAD